MKKIILSLSATAFALTGSLFFGCSSSADKVNAAETKVQSANQELVAAKQELNAEYPSFRKEAEVQIAANDKRIDELKERLDKRDKAPLNNIRKRRIEELETKNAELRSRLYGYEKERSDWESFKIKFKHDMDNLGDAFRDFGKDMKK